MELWWLRIILGCVCKTWIRTSCLQRKKIVLFTGKVGKVPWKEGAKMILCFLSYVNSRECSLVTLNFEPMISQYLFLCVTARFVSLVSVLSSVKWEAGWLSGPSFSHLQGPPQVFDSLEPQPWGCCKSPNSWVFAISVPYNSEGFLQPEVFYIKEKNSES